MVRINEKDKFPWERRVNSQRIQSQNRVIRKELFTALLRAGIDSGNIDGIPTNELHRMYQEKGLVHSPVDKKSKDMNRQLSEEEIKAIYSHMKKCSKSLLIREVQIKTTPRYHITPISLANMTKQEDNKCWRRCGRFGTLIHCWLSCELIQLFCRAIWNYDPKGYKNVLTLWPSNIASRTIPPWHHKNGKGFHVQNYLQQLSLWWPKTGNQGDTHQLGDGQTSYGICM